MFLAKRETEGYAFFICLSTTFGYISARYDKIPNQRRALQEIVTNQGKKLLELARDIATQGTNPMDRMLVISSEDNHDHYIVLEGNRRLAALKLLTNSALLDSLSMTSTLRKNFNKLAPQLDRNAIEPLECALCDSREEANHWIELRHTGENNGAGIVGWDGVATARFRGKEASLQAIDFVKKFGNLDSNTLKNLQKFSITNLDRLLGDPYVREALGLKIIDRKLCSNLPKEESVKGLEKIVSDIANRKITVTNIDNKPLRQKYIDNLPANVKPSFEKSVDYWALDTAEIVQKSAKSKRSMQQSTDRKTLIPTKCKLVIPDARTNAIYKELRELRVEKFSNAVAVLFRVFIELSVDYYITNKATGINRNISFLKKCHAAIAHMVEKGGMSKDDLEPVKIAISQETSPLYHRALHNYVHNRFMQPIPKNLLISWDNAQILFEKIWS